MLFSDRAISRILWNLRLSGLCEHLLVVSWKFNGIYMYMYIIANLEVTQTIEEIQEFEKCNN